MQMSRSLPVAVFDSGSPTALAFTRALGRAGIEVHVYSHSRWPAARLSRYAHSFHRSPDTDEANIFLPWLEDAVRAGRIRLVAPTSDIVAFYLAEIESSSTEAVARAMPNREAILTSLLKDRFDAACARLSIRTPRAIYPNSIEEAMDEAGSLRYPAIIKPRSHVGVGVERGLVVESDTELRARYRPYSIPPRSDSIFARYPELRWPLVQEYVPRALANLYSVSGVIAPDGTTLAAAASRKLAQWPPALGVGTIFEPCHDADLVVRGVGIARQILGNGLFELELIYDARSKDYVAIDLNPRAYGQISFDIARGLNLPLLWYECAVGAETRAPAPPGKDVIWIHSLPYHVDNLVGILRGPGRLNRLAEYRAKLARRRVDIVHDSRDPLPSVAYLAGILNHPGGLIRPFLRGAPRQL